MKFYGWFIGRENEATKYIFFEGTSVDSPYSTVIQCENVDDIYVVEDNFDTYYEAIKKCESVGQSMIKDLDIDKFTSTDKVFHSLNYLQNGTMKTFLTLMELTGNQCGLIGSTKI